MDQRQMREQSPFLLMAFGAILFLIAGVHYAHEILVLNTLIGPLVALLLDGVPALGLIYAGYCLSQIEFTLKSRWTVVSWSLIGGVVFLIAMGTTVLVRLFEGRPIAEPVFPLLIAVEAGAIAGMIAGYYNARAHADARRAEKVSDTLVFVNDLIRHDLRNDLTVIQGYTEHISHQQTPATAETESDNLEVISEKTGEALTRIEATRAIIDSLIGETDLEPVNLAAVIAELASQVETSSSAAVTTHLPDQALVTANASLRSVVDNLLENAVEHNDRDDSLIEVMVKADVDTVRMTVSDNGPGISDKQKETLFNTNGTETDRGGGLSLVWTLVESYGGNIRVEDNEPCGSTFIVELPRADAQEEISE
ncbi:ATP-binding protein [Natrinema hispanicum]|uniref:histidine kinase n=1 Tax=Natrinema hispanicum TaxID=392421 RepID=A0A1G6XXR4_9EURY|nr:ATP-binding protein [Natrinema hispanicum]SDD82227.1 hypothetical protein SAMN05192552_105315 [Natrinema hispanicum]